MASAVGNVVTWIDVETIKVFEDRRATPVDTPEPEAEYLKAALISKCEEHLPLNVFSLVRPYLESDPYQWHLGEMTQPIPSVEFRYRPVDNKVTIVAHRVLSPDSSLAEFGRQEDHIFSYSLGQPLDHCNGRVGNRASSKQNATVRNESYHALAGALYLVDHPKDDMANLEMRFDAQVDSWRMKLRKRGETMQLPPIEESPQAKMDSSRASLRSSPRPESQITDPSSTPRMD